MLGVAHSTDKANTVSSQADIPVGTRVGRTKHRSYNRATRHSQGGQERLQKNGRSCGGGRVVFRGWEHFRQSDSKSDALRQREQSGGSQRERGRAGGDTDHLGPLKSQGNRRPPEPLHCPGLPSTSRGTCWAAAGVAKHLFHVVLTHTHPS